MATVLCRYLRLSHLSKQVPVHHRTLMQQQKFTLIRRWFFTFELRTGPSRTISLNMHTVLVPVCITRYSLMAGVWWWTPFASWSAILTLTTIIAVEVCCSFMSGCVYPSVHALTLLEDWSSCTIPIVTQINNISESKELRGINVCLS